jgi:hypothetical protein
MSVPGREPSSRTGNPGAYSEQVPWIPDRRLAASAMTVLYCNKCRAISSTGILT